MQYIEAWLRGRGAVPIYNLMEDAATAEISRAQVWQWIHLKAKLDDGREVTPEMFRPALCSEMERVKGEVGAEPYEGGRFPEAIKLFSDMSLAPRIRGVFDPAGVPADRLTAVETCGGDGDGSRRNCLLPRSWPG